MMKWDSKLEEQTWQRLVAAGWQRNDILVSPIVPSGQGAYRPDFVLLHNLYPLAVLEVTGAARGEVQRSRAAQYAEIVGVPFALVTDPAHTVLQSLTDEHTHPLSNLPSPSELWSSLGRQWNEDDPRLFPPTESERPPSLIQAQAVSRIIDAIMAGAPRVRVDLAPGLGRSYVMLQCAWKLVKSSFRRRVLFLSSSPALLAQARDTFRPFGHDVVLLHEPTDAAANGRVHCSTLQRFVAQGVAGSLTTVPGDLYDTILYDAVPEFQDLQLLADHFSGAQHIVVSPGASSETASTFDPPVFQYSVQDAIEVEYTQPPKGYRAARLGEIAEVKAGPKIRTVPRPNNPNEAVQLVVMGKDIRSDGTLDLQSLSAVESHSVENTYRLQPGDIVLLSVLGAATYKVALVPQTLPAFLTFGSNIIRIRVNAPSASAKDVYDYLHSDIGQRFLRMLTAGAVIPRVTARSLAELVIFLPEQAGSPADVSKELTATARALRDLTDVVVPGLTRAAHEEANGVPSEVTLQEVAARLKSLATFLVPEPLPERVVTQYPMPIALAYRRFAEARFNVYEQVLRLRDLFEATAFFLYNVLLVDACRNLDPRKYFIDDGGARRAYGGYSMAARLSFVGKVLEVAGSNSGQDLFIPELANVATVVDVGKRLQDELRNRMSHTAAASESQQKQIVDEFQPLIEQMLKELDFLTQYPLVRIASYSVRHQHFVRRTFIYKGVAPNLVEESVVSSTISPVADSEHLILLANDDRVLDLYPVYQLVANAETRHETHLCFLKQRKTQHLVGESVQASLPLELEGADEFEALQRRLLDKL